ncbi:DUF4180 domain-containing protein [Zooshikella marina]|uniref:DUF4180 domain-containing protein n=1 Tax=Zooshikella ganghwensis TaxID=202772 RepID=UPI001BAF47C2|nr:DUF4180 domain-containing protein [Zooshikella ganghwensis]MBU2707064.1 DUF4180 domain-containing protein [Zooshikella ganghwensis]
MDIEIIECGSSKIAKLSSEAVINSVQSATDLMGNADYQGASKIIVSEASLGPLFFDLKTGIAGEILQKASNYHKQLAIVGEFEKYNSNALKAFIIECNRGNHIFFMPDLESAINKLI